MYIDHAFPTSSSDNTNAARAHHLPQPAGIISREVCFMLCVNPHKHMVDYPEVGRGGGGAALTE